MSHEKLSNDSTDGPATDEELLQGKWTGKGVSDYPRGDELIRMVKLLARREAISVITTMIWTGEIK